MILCLNREAYNQGYDVTFSFDISEELSPPPDGKRAECRVCTIDYSGRHDVAGAICQRDGKGACNEWLSEAKIVLVEYG